MLGDRRTETLRHLGLHPDPAVADLAAEILLLRSEQSQPSTAIRLVTGDVLVEALQLTATDPALAFDQAVSLWSDASADGATHTAAVAGATAARAAARLAMVATAQHWRKVAHEAVATLSAHHAFDRHVAHQLLRESALHLLAVHSSSPHASGWLNELTGLPIEQLTAWIPAAIEERAVSLVVRDGEVVSARTLGVGDVRQLAEFTQLAVLEPAQPLQPGETVRVPPRWAMSYQRHAARLGTALFTDDHLTSYLRSVPVAAVVPVGKFVRTCLSELVLDGAPLREHAALWTPIVSTALPAHPIGAARLELHAHLHDAGECPRWFRHIERPPDRELVAGAGGVLLLHAHGASAGGTGGISHAMTADDAADVVLELDDGPLAAGEVASWPLSGWGVVILACGAGGFGSGIRGERSLAAALLSAGASWVLANPWLVPISQETNRFVERFVTEMEGGALSASALANAQQWAAEQGQRPFAWQSWRLFT